MGLPSNYSEHMLCNILHVLLFTCWLVDSFVLQCCHRFSCSNIKCPVEDIVNVKLLGQKVDPLNFWIDTIGLFMQTHSLPMYEFGTYWNESTSIFVKKSQWIINSPFSLYSQDTQHIVVPVGLFPFLVLCASLYWISVMRTLMVSCHSQLTVKNVIFVIKIESSPICKWLLRVT